MTTCDFVSIWDHFWSSFWFSNKQYYLFLLSIIFDIRLKKIVVMSVPWKMPNLKSASTHEQTNDKTQHQECEEYDHRTCHNSTDSRDAQNASIWRRKSSSHTLAIPCIQRQFCVGKDPRAIVATHKLPQFEDVNPEVTLWPFLASRDNFAQEKNPRAASPIAGLSARIHFSNSDLSWVSDTEVLSTSRSSACWNRLLAPWCSHAQNECHVISSPDMNLHVLVTSSRSMQEHAAKFT